MLETKIKTSVCKGFKVLYDYALSLDEVVLQPTRKEFEGTHTFVIFPFLKITKAGPEKSGRQLGEWLTDHSADISAFNVVKGFLNLEIKHVSWVKELERIAAKSTYGSFPSNGKKVMVEFSSPNTNKPLHLGHLRNNFLGDAAARILDACGYEVMKVNLVNDRGVHICKSMLAYQKSGNGETPESTGLKGDHLAGKYYVEFDKRCKEEINTLIGQGISPEEARRKAPSVKEVREMLQKWESGDKETVALWKKINNWVYEGFDKTYETMGIQFDRTYKESDTYLLGKEIVEEGIEKGIFFKKEDDSVWVDLTEEGLDEKLILRADGTAVYMTQDMGTCDMKYKDFSFDRSVYVVGNEQDYHFKVFFAIMKKLGRKYAKGLHHLSYGMVDLPSGKMKSREGTVVDADDLLQEMFDTAAQHTKTLGKTENMSDEEAKKLHHTLGLGALKYFLLKVDPKKRILFNPAASIEFQGHTGPFIQYTYARIAAILKRANSLGIDAGFDADKIDQISRREIHLIYRISGFENAVMEAGRDYSPAVMAQYIYDLAKDYNGFYQEVPIFHERNKEITRLRIVLSSVTGSIIKKAMRLLGIKVPERM